MKKLLLTFTVIVLAIINNYAAHLTSSIQITARCNGGNEVPAVMTDGQGLAVITVAKDRLSAHLSFQATALSGDITGIHIHDGSQDENGPVVVNLTPFLNGLELEANLTNTSNFSIQKLIRGDYYLNVHTEQNPGGEIRGQLTPETDYLFGGVLLGDNEIPAVSTDAEGFASAALSSNGSSLDITAVFQNLSGPITGAHLHMAEAGANGGVVVNLSDFILDSLLTTSISIDSAVAEALKAGNIYLNIHTMMNPGGEIRAQLLPMSNMAFDVFLTGSNEVPMVETNVLGLMNFDIDLENNTLNYAGFIQSPNSDIVGAHIHLGAADENGPVIVNLTTDISGQFISGSSNKLTSTLIDAMLTGGAYVNIHTQDNPGGEVRGQITRLLREGYIAQIDSTQTVPGTTSEARGIAMMSIDRNQTNGHFMFVVDGLADDYTAAHFHDGGPGDAGGVLFDLGPFVVNGAGGYGYWNDMGDAAPLFRTTGIYINVHTGTYPSGEVRGDFSRSSTLNIGVPDFNRAQLFVSSNTSCALGVLISDYDGDDALYTVPTVAQDADGLYFSQKDDALFQVNRSANRIDRYNNTLQNIQDGNLLMLGLSSSSDFSNARELTSNNEVLIVAQDASDDNDQTNALFTYQNAEDTIELVKTNTVNINLWGIQLVDSTLWAIEDNSPNVVWYNNFLDLAEGNIETSGTVSIENMVRTHGLSYEASMDAMFLTDVGEASSDDDGAIVIVENWSTAIADGVVSADEQVRIEGASTNLGNPVDIAFDLQTNTIWVAERANGGGQVLAFAKDTLSGDQSPISAFGFSGASAVYFNSTRAMGEFTPVDPDYTGELLFAGRLSGNNEVPAVTTAAQGVIGVTINETFETATINLSVNGLEGNFTGVHLHKAASGENGDVVVNLTDAFTNNIIRTEVEVDSALINDMLAGNIYVNVHTDSNPSGEIRAQVLLEKDRSFVNWINGDQEVPAVMTEANGLVSAQLTSVLNTLSLNAFFTGLSGNVTGAHLHVGEEGSNGGVVFNLTDYVCENNRIVAELDASPFIDDLLAGNIYLNIHTAENPGGEIRAQLNEWAGISSDGWIAGEQSVPAIQSAGLGLAAMNLSEDRSTVTVWAVSDYLPSGVAAAHIHTADQGENGGVWINLADGIDDTNIAFSSSTFDPSLISNFLRGDVYINIHTADYPSGEIRGQLYPMTREGYNYAICTDLETTEVTGAENANGGGIASIDNKNSNLHLMAVVSNTSGPITGAHLHQAPVGESGGVILNLTDLEENGGIFTYYTSEDFGETIGTPIKEENVYINWHTEANPAGELRGQILNDISCPISSFVFDYGETIEQINVFPNPSKEVLNLEFDDASGEYPDILIRNLNGQIVRSQRLNNQKQVRTGDLIPGIYILEVKFEDRLSIAKFTKI